jgi:Phosphate-induced protein 1 conserved region
VRKRISRLMVGVATLALGSAGAVGAAGPAGATGAAHAHLLLTKQLVDRTTSALGVNTGCFGTGSPGCLPVPLQYNGGPVQQAGTTEYVVFWEPAGSTVSPSYNSLITRFFNDVGGSSLYGVATQYYQGTSQQHIVNSSHLGGTWVDTSAYPSSSLSDADMQNEVTKAISANGWTTGINSQVYVFLAKGENECQSSGTCSFSTFCAYHGYFTNAGQTVTYGVMPYAGTNLSGCGTQGAASPNNDQDSDAEISITSHELMETVTDPLLTAWYDATGAEIGDKCAYTYGSTAANGSNITMNGHPYIVQEEFSNAQLGCSLS